MKFGDYIRQKREKNSWTQPEAAARANIEQSYLSKLETGKSYPSEEVFDKLVSAYELDISELGRQVQSDELEKLKEVSKVRTYILHQQKTHTHLLRGWLLAGLIMLMLGGGLVLYETMQPTLEGVEYRYVSQGVLKPNEPDIFFRTIGLPGHPEASPDIVERMVPKSKTLPDDLGERFIELEGKNRRVYEARGEKFYERPQRDLLMIAIGFSMVLGSLASFFIASRWR